jgi:hypothetical protein
VPRLNSKAKGAAYEREVADYLSGRLGARVQRTRSTIDGDGAQGAYDLAGLDGLAPECKRVEAIRLHEFFAQAVRNATGGRIPVVITRRNRVATGDSLVVLKLSDFTDLYQEFLAANGRV